MKSKKEIKVTKKETKKVSKASGSTKKPAAEKKKPAAKKANKKDAEPALTKAKKAATKKPTVSKESVKLAKKTTTETKTAKKETKKFFPKDAKPSAAPTGALEPKVVSKRTPWMKKPIENPHSTPAGPCINLKDLFDNYLDKKYKKLKDEQRHQLWKQVSLQMLTEPFSRLNEIIDSHLSRK